MLPDMNNIKSGKVFLVGAGCGDPELLTVKGMRLLKQADVVLTDRLVSPEIIERYTTPGTEVVYVCKQCRKGESTPQATINELKSTVSSFNSSKGTLGLLMNDRAIYDRLDNMTNRLKIS